MLKLKLALPGFLVTVALLVSTELSCADRVIRVGEKRKSGDTQEPDIIPCDSFECIKSYINDSTKIQFVSSEFVLTESWHFCNLNNIQLEGNSTWNTTIICESHLNEVGFVFINIQSLDISNITIKNCGHSYTFKKQLSSAILLVQCTDVNIHNTRILHSPHIGLGIVNTNGIVTVTDSTFDTSGLASYADGVQNGFVTYGGGVQLLKERCSLYHTSDTCSSHQCSLNNAVYNFARCNFTHNANQAIDSTENRMLGRGGGLGVYMKDEASNNTVIISKCRFFHNSANRGAGISTLFRDSAQNNMLIVQDSHFVNNVCGKSGGGMNLVHIGEMETNRVIVKNSQFVDNIAVFGGGVAMHSTANIVSHMSNSAFTFTDCVWEHNTAQFAAAMDIFTNSFQNIVKLSDCKFLGNQVIHKAPFNELIQQSLEGAPRNASSQEMSRENYLTRQYAEGSGVVLATYNSIHFEGNTSFISNIGTALHLITAAATFAPNSTVLFKDNCGFQGGAVALIGLSEFNVHPNSNFTFLRNNASYEGGAIYYHSLDQHEFLTGSSDCFIRRLGDKYSTSDSQTINFTFDGNRARRYNGSDIQATTIKHCRRMCDSRDKNNPTDIFKCIGNFKFSNLRTSLATTGGLFAENIPLPIKVIPGKEFSLNFTLRDDLNNETAAIYSVSVDGDGVFVGHAYSIIATKELKLYGTPGQNATITLTKIGIRLLALSFKVEISQCPPGFVIHHLKRHNMEFPICVCALNTDQIYNALTRCNTTHFFAYAQRGYWFGYNDQDVLYSAHCPFSHCSINQAYEEDGSIQEYRLPDSMSKEKLEKVVCKEHRTGIACGKCVSKHSAYYHTYDYICGSDESCNYGWLLYIASELLPLTILFLVVMCFKISFTNGIANGFIFFAQIVDSLIINGFGAIWLHPVTWNLTQVHNLIYRLFNFDFFSNEIFSFCLFKGATTLDILAFKYVTILYALFMIFAMVLTLNYCNIYIYHKNLCSIGYTLKNSVIHGISAFLIMCYAQCIRVSLLLLTSISIEGRGGVKIRSVLFFNGEVDFFSEAHLKYAIPALAFLIIALIPPILLLVYPIHYRVIAALKVDEKPWFLLITKYISLEKMKPLLDSFQSCFKDEYRFFAGLYFFYRLLTLLMFAASSSYTLFYAVVEIQLIIILAIHAYVQPYKIQLHNKIDTLIFLNLALINALTLFNYSIVTQRAVRSNVVQIFSAIQLILIYLPLCVLLLYVLYKALKKAKALLKKNMPKANEETEQFELPARLLYNDEEDTNEESTYFTKYEESETY